MLAAAGLVFAGANQQGTASGGKPTLSPPGLSGDDLAFSKFTKPVDVHIGHSVNPLDTTLPKGDTVGSNQYTRYYLDKFNINIIVDWTAASVMGDGIMIMAIQKNWLDQYNLPVPKTLDDIENVARVFKEKAPAGAATIPIAGPDKNGSPYRTFIESLSNDKTFDPVFNAYDVYPVISWTTETGPFPTVL